MEGRMEEHGGQWSYGGGIEEGKKRKRGYGRLDRVTVRCLGAGVC